MRKQKNIDLEIIPTESMVKDLGVLFSLKSEQISSFAEIVNSTEGFGIPNDANLAQIVRRTAMTGDEFEQIYRVTKYLYDKLAEKQGGFEDLLRTIQSIAREHNLPSPNRKEAALKKLFSVPVVYQNKLKFEPHREGIVHRLSSIKYTLEARAAFDVDSDEALTLLGYIPISTIRLIAENDKEEKQNFLFTVDAESLGKLIERLKKIKDKLEHVRKDLSGKGVEIR